MPEPAFVPPSDSPRRMPPAAPAVGARVDARFTKWGDLPHWHWGGYYLGADEHGLWFFALAGTRCRRPGRDFLEDDPWVSLIPHTGGWVAGFYPQTKHVPIYVDMTTPARWIPPQSPDGPWGVTMVDLDLDVVLTNEGHLFVDDEDEYEEHRVEFRYPDDVCRAAEAARDEVFLAIANGAEPFASVGFGWLQRGIELTGSEPERYRAIT